MLRTLFAAALALVLALPAPSVHAQTSTQSLPEITLGRSYGAWDLPGSLDVGRARGILVDLNGRRLALEAKLMPAAVRDGQAGRVLGALLTLDREGNLGRPVAELSGGYIGGTDGFGRFELVITPLDGVALRGRIRGRYADPMVRGKDKVGRYAGEWILR